MMRRFICLLLAFVMVAGMLPLQIMAEENPEATMETAPAAEASLPPETAEETLPPETTMETVSSEAAEETQPAETTEETVPPETAEETAPSEITAETLPPPAPEASLPPETEPVPEPTQQEPEELVMTEVGLSGLADDYTPDQALMDYFQRELMGGISGYGMALGNSLTGDTRVAYDAIVEFLRDIADGKRTSSILLIGTNNISGFTPDVRVPIDFRAIDREKLMDALRYDYAYLMYWFDMYGEYITSWRDSAYTSVMFIFNVAEEYRTDTVTTIKENNQVYEYYTTVNINKTHAPKAAAARAHQLVKDKAGKTDYEKLLAYANWIADNVSYDHNAANNNTAAYDVDPWQIIHTFDGDPSTNVVCEGYAKSMQLLCDISDFSADIECYCVAGNNHMWNIIRIDGVSYLTDVTGYDDDTGAYQSVYFLAGGTPDANGGYSFGSYYYIYYDYVKSLWPAGVLTLTESYYIWTLNPDVPTAVRITLDGNDITYQTITVPAGAVIRLSAVVYPQTASQNVHWHSNDPKIAKFTGDGLFTAVGAGETALFAIVPDSNDPSSWSDLMASFRIRVEADTAHVHTPVLTGQLAPTCTAAGYTGDTICSECKSLLQEGSKIDSLGHDPKAELRTEPTCTTDGFTGNTVCARCSELLQAGTVIPKLNHLPKTLGAVQPTCTTEGFSGNIICIRCDALIEAGQTLAPLNHIPQLVNKEEPACTVPGYSGDKQCTLCKEIYESGRAVPALGHDYISETIPQKEATDTEYGHSSFQVLSCSRCDLRFHEDRTEMTEEELTQLKAEHRLYAAPRAVFISQLDGTRVPSIVNIPDYPNGLALKAEVSPATAEQTVYWTVSNVQVATADDSGLVTFRKPGTVTISAKANDSCFASATITARIPAEDLEISSSTGSNKLLEGQSLALTATVFPAEADQTVIWSLAEGNETFASISMDGVVTAKDVSQQTTVTVMAASLDGSSASFDVVIHPAADSIRLFLDGHDITGTSLDLRLCGSMTLDALVFPDGTLGASQEITWTSSNEAIAGVDPDGSIIPAAEGDVTISAAAADGSGVTAAVTVRILNHALALEDNLAPTCTQTGFSGNYRCTNCLEIIEQGQVLEALGHDHITVTVPEKAPSDEAFGYASFPVTACSRCDQWFNTDLTDMTEEQLDALKEEHILYAQAKSVSICSGDGTDAPSRLNGRNYPETMKLKAEILPGTAEQTVTWKSSNESIATVSQEGLVEFHKPGSVTITAAAADGSGAKKSVRIHAVQLVTSLEFLQDEYSVRSGKSLTLKPKVYPSNANNKAYTWSTLGMPDGVTLRNGVITVSKKLETAASFSVIVTADDGGLATDECLVTVYPIATRVVMTRDEAQPAESSMTVTMGTGLDKTMQLGAAVYHEEDDSCSQLVKWSTSNSKVATVTQEGLVEFRKPGSATITATAQDGSRKKDTIKLRVTQVVEALELTQDAYTVSGGKRLTLKAAITPSNASNKTCTWSTDPLPAGVTFKNGVIRVDKRLDTAAAFTVRVSANDGGLAADECQVTVYPIATKVVMTRDGSEIQESSLPVSIGREPGKTLQLGAALYHNESVTASQQVSWNSSNKKIATVRDGLVEFHGPGTVTITATAADGSGKKDSVKFRVTQLVEELRLPETIIVGSGRRQTLKPEVWPKNANNKKYVWQPVQDLPEGIHFQDGVVMVDSGWQGVYSFNAVARACDAGAVVGQCRVTVYPSATKVSLFRDGASLTKKTISVDKDEALQLDALVYHNEDTGCSQQIIWSTGNSRIATVENGRITFHRAGIVTITAATVDGSKVKASVRIIAK